MAAETALLVTITKSLASGLLKEVVMKAMGAASESSTVAGLKSAIFGGLEDDLHLLENELSKLDYVLSSVCNIDPMQRDNNTLVLPWLKNVKNAASYADSLLDEIAYEKIRRKLQTETSSAAKFYARSAFCKRIAGKIKKFVSMAAKIHKDAEIRLHMRQLVGEASSAGNQAPSRSIYENVREIRENPDTSIVMGREADEKLIVTKLCSPDNDQILSVVAMVGRSGVGKTTLAKMVYDNNDVCEHFGKRTWIFVSDHFKLERFLNEMLESFDRRNYTGKNKVAMEDRLQDQLTGKKEHLLVLDDVWNTDVQLWKSVESSLLRISRFTRCKVLVTTQNSDVAKLMSASLAHELKDLGDAEAWELFKKLAFANKTEEQLSDLEDVGRQILSKCKGLPLAIKALGCLLGSMNDRSQWEWVERNELWGLRLEQSNLMPWLLISFDHLPSAAIKQCFVHCSVLIEKGQFVPKSEVIHAWMAQGFIQSTTGNEMSMEDIGEMYVSNLVATGLLQVDIQSKEKSVRDFTTYKKFTSYLWMHDLVHDLARYISKDASCILREACDLHTTFEAEHLRICGEGYWRSEFNFPKRKTLSMLRTLICVGAALSVDFAAQAPFLRDLRLIDCGLKKVPSSVGRLKHLRYLSLRGNPLRDLPDFITTLFNLQTLDLRECELHCELPPGFTKLVSLRHILNSNAMQKAMKIPKGMGQLTCLRTLPSIDLEEKKGFEINELKSLPFLSGDLRISNLQYIRCKEEAAEANLETKAEIRTLSLGWGLYGRRENKLSYDEEIMVGLHPHSNVEVIIVDGFGGKRLSSWLLHMHRLKTIVLKRCDHCEQLPALGQLASLEDIRIGGMKSVKVIGAGFYDSDQEGSTASSSSHNNNNNNSDMSRRRILFPRLKCLYLEDMSELREWVVPSESIYEVFPCLEKLKIRYCPLLVSAPTCFHSLLSLDIRGLESGEAVMNILMNPTDLIDLEILHVKQLTSLSHPLSKCSNSLKSVNISRCQELGELCPTFRYMGSLETLSVTCCHSLSSVPDIEGLLSLHTLEITECKNLHTIHGLESCVWIEKLILSGNSKLELIPDLKNFSRLTQLTLVDFSQQMSIPICLSYLSRLQYLSIGGLNEGLDQLEGATHLPKCLMELSLHGWPKLNSLPSEVRYLNQLERLGIVRFTGIERLPEWLGDLSSLSHLFFDNCHELKYLPSLDAMRRLTELRTLSMFCCPILRKRCANSKAEEWQKITHIPNKQFK